MPSPERQGKTEKLGTFAGGPTVGEGQSSDSNQVLLFAASTVIHSLSSCLLRTYCVSGAALAGDSEVSPAL